MDEDEKDIDKMSNNEIKESTKIKLQESIRAMNSSIEQSKYTLEKIDKIRFKEVHEVFYKELNWFFAISVGTLLWILSNFDKFTIADGSIPYKSLYFASILLVGASSVLLAKLQAEFFRYQHQNTKNYNFLINTAENTIEHAEEMKQYCENKIESQLFNSQSSNDVLNDLNKRLKYFEDRQIRLVESLDSLLESNIKCANVAFPENKMNTPLFLYIVGVLCFSVYIIIFMAKYV